MSILKNKIDFVALISVTGANSNGDPLNGNRPRTDYEGFGEISDVCIKRKIRNRMQDMGNKIFVQSNERSDDGAKSLKARAEKVLSQNTDPDQAKKVACETWMDVRTFGQVFAFKDKEDKKGKENKKDGVSIGIRGPVSIHKASSIDPVEIETFQITKSVNGEETEKGTSSSDRMGKKHFVRFGLYKLKGAINVQLAEKTGFSEEDADILKECLRTLFVNDASAARPDGSMEVVKLYWFKHNCKDGQYSSAKIHRSVYARLKNPEKNNCVDDYEYGIKKEEIPELVPEEIDGI